MILRSVTASAISLLLSSACTLVAPATPEPTTAPTPAETPTPQATATAAPVPTATAVATVSATATPSGYAGSGWTATALDLEPVGATFLFDCPPDGSISVAWGTDVYTADSSVCTAAVHAGVITVESGGDVTIEMRPGQESYQGSTRNGVTTVGYSSYDSSFVVLGAPQPPASPQPSPSPAEGFGPFTPLFNDDFSDPTSGWGTGSNDSGTIAYEPSGVLSVDVTAARRSLRSTRPLVTSWNALRVEAVMTPLADSGIFGLMCAESISEMVGALVSSDGAVIFADVSAGTVTVLARDDAAGVVNVPGLPTRLAVECAGTATGSTRLRVEANGDLVGTYDGGSEGPAAYSNAAVYAEAVGEPFTVNIDDLAAGGATGANLPSPAATGVPSGVAELLAHVPSAFRDRCQETPVSAFDEGAVVAVACLMQQDGRGAGAEVIEYVQFDSTDSMDATYQWRVGIYGGESTGSDCQQGPSEHAYTVDGTPAGRLLCAPQTSGIRFDWTDERLNILSTATDFDSSYPDLWDSWLEAGPTE